MGIGPRDVVRIASRRGSVEVTARLTRTVRPGQVFMPMHFAEANRLTFAAFDPHSRQPSYKMAAVRLDAIATSAARPDAR